MRVRELIRIVCRIVWDFLREHVLRNAVVYSLLAFFLFILVTS